MARFMTDAWRKQAAWLWLLLPLEWLYRTAVYLRCGAYRYGLLKRARLTVPVVIVGNIALGGTGKTPLVIALVEHLQSRGVRVGVVSRGHGRSSRGTHVITAASRVEQCGDEPLLIFKRTGCPCVVDEQRVRGAQQLIDTFNVELIVCDDGLQHYALQRDMEIILYDADIGMGNGRCLPVGLLREPVSRLGEADVILAKGRGAQEGDFYLATDYLEQLSTGQRTSVEAEVFTGTVIAVAGVAAPAGFFDLLRGQGLQINARSYPDHVRYTLSDLKTFGSAPVIMTEKDAVKCVELIQFLREQGDTGMPVDQFWFLRVSAKLPASLYLHVERLLKPKTA